MSTAIAPAFADARTFLFTEPRFKPSEHPHKASPAHVFRMPFIEAHLVGEISDDLIISQPLQIAIEQDEDGSFLVSDDIFLVYGDSDNQMDAIRDYVKSLIQFYRLVEKGAQTNKFDKVQLAQLQSYIRPRGNDAIQASRS